MAIAQRIQRSYSEADVVTGLSEVALCGGNTRLAHQRLKARGQVIPRATLESWRTTIHPDRYSEIKRDLAPKIAEAIAAEAEDLAVAYAEAERRTLARYLDQLDDLKAGEIAGAARNLTTSKSLNIDKVASPLRGRPSRILEHRDSHDIVKRLAELAPSAFVVDGTAEEIRLDTDEPPDEETGENPAS
jgi:hypothetical protein